jgi:hypothetical protein
MERFTGAPFPDEYRRFLVELGNGGAGPGYYGLRATTLKVLGWADHSRPFPHSAAWTETTPRDAPPPQGEASYDHPCHTAGSVSLADYGCALDARLILTGPERGRVWMNDPNMRGVYPFTPELSVPLHSLDGDPSEDDHHFTFMEWYSDWLTRLIQDLEADVLARLAEDMDEDLGT